MRHSRFISSTTPIAGLLTSLLFAVLVVPLNADDSHSWYDVSREVTLSGTVSSVLHKPAHQLTARAWCKFLSPSDLRLLFPAERPTPAKAGLLPDSLPLFRPEKNCLHVSSFAGHFRFHN
jgi:hypothetical protein